MAEEVLEFRDSAWIPSFERKEIHPALDFCDDCVYVGLWLRAKRESEKGTEERDRLFFLTNGELKSQDKIKSEGIGMKTRPVKFDLRISNKDIILGQVYIVKFCTMILTNYISLNSPNQLLTQYLINEKVTSSLAKLETLKQEQNIPTLYTQPTLESESAKYYVQNYTNYTNYVLNMGFALIKERYDYYLDLLNDEKKLNALWDLGSYFFPLFGSYPYLFIHGMKQTGKSSVLVLKDKLCFNALLTGSTTAASVFRYIDGMRPTMLIDETDLLATTKNKPELRSILLNGYKRSSPAVTRAFQPRAKQAYFIPEKYYVYCPKALANIRGLEDVLEDRTITIVMKRTRRQEFGNRLDQIENDRSLIDIRDLLYLIMINTWKDVKSIYNGFENTTKLKSRDWELWKPILVLAWMIDDQLYRDMVKFACQKCEEKKEEDVFFKAEYQVVKILFVIVKEKAYYSLKEILTHILEFEEYKDAKWMTSQWLGHAMKRLGFKKKRRVGGGMQYFLTPKEVKEQVNCLGIDVSKVEEEIIIGIDKDKREVQKDLEEKL